jgi:adenylate kinase
MPALERRPARLTVSMPGNRDQERRERSTPVALDVTPCSRMTRRVVILGPPGSGKGTQAQPLAREHGLAHVSTGDLLRQAGGEAKRYMERGELVPDDVVLALVRDAIGDGGYVLDGFPRTVAQAEALDAALQEAGRPLPEAVLLDVPDEEVVRRLAGRGREDDDPATVRHRLGVYHEQTEPVIAYYEQRDRLRRVDGTGDPEDVARRLSDTA